MIPHPAGNPQFWLLNGPFFILLLLLSICSVSLIVEKLLLLGRWRKRGLPNHISRLLRDGKMQELSALLKPERGPEAILVRKSLPFIHSGPGNAPLRKAPGQLECLKQQIESCIGELGLQLEKHCNLFHLIANVSTLLGLLGTVTGMIYAFQSGALEQGTALAQGISQALVTTAGGLIVAIPALIAQQLFLNSSTLRIAALERLGNEILLFMYQNLLEETAPRKTTGKLQKATSSKDSRVQLPNAKPKSKAQNTDHTRDSQSHNSFANRLAKLQLERERLRKQQLKQGPNNDAWQAGKQK